MIAEIGKRRVDVLSMLKASAKPLTIVEIAAELGIHANTVRFHLDHLQESGQVERVQPQHRSPGRPAQMYQAVRRMDPTGPTRYRVLAEILAEGLATDDNPAAKAREMGRAWGRTVQRPAATSPADALLHMLDDFGFAPEPPEGGQLRLRHCPFLELAQTRAAVVCPIHLGLMQGALESWRGSWSTELTVGRLDPFVEPDVCLAHLEDGATR
ncbi:putative ArsR family transcriptional regulator [Mycobacterium frederiksbergense]|uniref:ArsR family transcriptional regulator n=1 Tax=Mycolicibacterium frederiksbergense TaxID=117567 RepID=A0ABT6KRU8_9MYCO|nr:helix-turn-helix domain-containing protein [Mycolicibacterium frederiksbergense]MDH6193461.1 putative ArsR family transcriptional regulator [Mycolicibacterium frederiksbergense]